MDETLKRYEELIDRLYKSEQWITKQNTTWEEIKTTNPNTYQLRQNIIQQLELIQKSLHKEE